MVGPFIIGAPFAAVMATTTHLLVFPGFHQHGWAQSVPDTRTESIQVQYRTAVSVMRTGTSRERAQTRALPTLIPGLDLPQTSTTLREPFQE